MTNWTAPGVMTDPGEYAHLLDDLPADPAVLLAVPAKVMVHEFWEDAYGLTLEPPPRATVNTRRAEGQLAAVVERDDRPLSVTREPGSRIPTNCRGFTVLAVTLLRAKGIPARSRCGFATYFTAGFHEDHWVAEWHDGERWRLADAQLDDVQRTALGITFDTTDLSREQFVIAGDAWRRYHAGADPDTFGLSGIKEAGAWWIAANLVRDVAAVRHDVEVLPWDVWDVMPGPEDAVDEAYFDALADGSGELTVPDRVFNVQRQRLEPLR